MTTRLRRPLINSTPGVLLIKGGPGTGKTMVALHRVPALHATLSENGNLLRQSSHRLSRRRRTPRRHRLDQAFIRHACTSPNETGEGVSVSWWLASLLCFLLFAPQRHARAIVLPENSFSLSTRIILPLPPVSLWDLHVSPARPSGRFQLPE